MLNSIPFQSISSVFYNIALYESRKRLQKLYEIYGMYGIIIKYKVQFYISSVI